LKNELKEVEMELHEVKGEKETLIIEKNLLAATLEEVITVIIIFFFISYSVLVKNRK
jgi:hypothetical protein